MCGIAGIIDLQGQREINPALLQRMADAMIHRGPDGEGFFIAEGVGFAHRRLAIIDIKGGAQPFQARTKGGTLTYNGEIYNYADLATMLRDDNVTLNTKSDTETIAEGISLHGPDWLTRMKGMFALGFWDPQQKSLLLARDRVGEKPLYYGQTNDGYLLFASEIGALIASDKFDRTLNHEAVADYLWFGYVPDPKSIWRGIYKLPPGHLLTASAQDGINVRQWWSPDYTLTNRLDYADATDHLSEQLNRSVTAQMVADVPLGAFLSGGADSAGIVSAMAATGAKPITCSIGFDNNQQDERPQAREIADHFNTDHHEEVAILSTSSLIDEVANAFGEPFGDSSALPTSIVSHLARRHVTVALSGDGGDEIFAGYRRYSFFLGEERLRSLLPESLRQAVFRPLGAIYPKLDQFPRPLRFKTTFQALGDTQGHAYARATSIMLPDQMRAMASAEFLDSLAGYEPATQVSDTMNDAGTDDPLARALYCDLKLWLAGRMLVKVDRASMMHSLEVRPPLLDPDLLQWSAQLPSMFKIHNGVRKRIFKDAISDRLPNNYLNRPKRGFALPLSNWLAANDMHIINRLHDSSKWKQSGIFNVETVNTMMNEQQTGRRNHAQALWSLIMFDAFLQLP